MSAVAEVDESVGERLVGVHGHVSGYVVEDIRFGQIVQAIRTANCNGGRKRPVSQTIEELKSRYISADRLRLKPGERAQKLVHIFQPRNTFWI